MPDLDNATVRDRESWYTRNPASIQRLIGSSDKYIYHVIEALESRNMPTEIALLPYVESSFNPLAVSSANVHGNDAALTIADAVAQLGDACSVYLDAGEMAGPVPSTIVDLTGPRARVLRAGRITVQELNEAVPGLVEQSEESHEG